MFSKEVTPCSTWACLRRRVVAKFPNFQYRGILTYGKRGNTPRRSLPVGNSREGSAAQDPDLHRYDSCTLERNKHDLRKSSLANFAGSDAGNRSRGQEHYDPRNVFAAGLQRPVVGAAVSAEKKNDDDFSILDDSEVPDPPVPSKMQKHTKRKATSSSSIESEHIRHGAWAELSGGRRGQDSPKIGDHEDIMPTPSSALEDHHMKSHRRVVRKPHLYALPEVRKSVQILCADYVNHDTLGAPWPWVTWFQALTRHRDREAVEALADKLWGSPLLQRIPEPSSGIQPDGILSEEAASHIPTSQEVKEEKDITFNVDEDSAPTLAEYGAGRGRKSKGRVASSSSSSGGHLNSGTPGARTEARERVSMEDNPWPAFHSALHALVSTGASRKTFMELFRRLPVDRVSVNAFNIALTCVKHDHTLRDKQSAATDLVHEMQLRAEKNPALLPDDYTWNTVLACCRPLQALPPQTGGERDETRRNRGEARAGVLVDKRDEIDRERSKFTLPAPELIFSQLVKKKTPLTYLGIIRLCRYRAELAMRYHTAMLAEGYVCVQATTCLLISLKLAGEPFAAYKMGYENVMHNWHLLDEDVPTTSRGQCDLFSAGPSSCASADTKSNLEKLKDGRNDTKKINGMKSQHKRDEEGCEEESRSTQESSHANGRKVPLQALDKAYYMKLIETVGVPLARKAKQPVLMHNIKISTKDKKAPYYAEHCGDTCFSSDSYSEDASSEADHEDHDGSSEPEVSKGWSLTAAQKMQIFLLREIFAQLPRQQRSNPEVVHKILSVFLTIKKRDSRIQENAKDAGRSIYLRYRGSMKAHAMAAWGNAYWHSRIEELMKGVVMNDQRSS
ncbi:unnamed protein product [Amoebophrya sp. A25]|nr:unnamed protein product [Amoebophrya sp. A25]|eukprot:GSA25T00005350001.1